MFQKPLPRRARLPLSFIPPMKPLLVDEPPGGEDWIHEIKYDGWRLQLIIADDIRAFTKNGIDYSRQLRPIIEATRSLGARDTILDGELIIQGDDGRSDFHGLRSAMTNAPELEITGRTTGRIANAPGFGGHGEPVRCVRTKSGRVLQLQIAGTGSAT